MLRCWLSSASLAVVITFTVAGGGRASKFIHGACRTYAVSKTFTMTRYITTNNTTTNDTITNDTITNDTTTNDTITNNTEVVSNGTCTIRVLAFQCGGFCETFAEISYRGAKFANGVYSVKFEEKCKCCDSRTIEMRVPPNTFDCLEDPTVKWNQEVVYHTAPNNAACVCQTCRGSNVLPPLDDH